MISTKPVWKNASFSIRGNLDPDSSALHTPRVATISHLMYTWINVEISTNSEACIAWQLIDWECDCHISWRPGHIVLFGMQFTLIGYFWIRVEFVTNVHHSLHWMCRRMRTLQSITFEAVLQLIPWSLWQLTLKSQKQTKNGHIKNVNKSFIHT
jgi:hypothetical protein